MNYLLGLLVAVATTSPIALEQPTMPVEPPSVAECNPVPKEIIYAKIAHYASIYGVSEGMMDYIVRNESHYSSCAIGDTHLTDPDGNPHLSLGAVQINRYWNPDVTEAEAYDIDFSLNFLADALSKGHCSRWTTCRAFQRLVASP